MCLERSHDFDGWLVRLEMRIQFFDVGMSCFGNFVSF